MKKISLTIAAIALAVGLTACGATETNSSRPRTPMPSSVPTEPEYTTADAVMKALGAGGLECTLLRRAQANFGSGLDCLAEVEGVKVENEIHVLDPAKFSRDDIGDSIAGRRKSPYNNTIVAAGNWYIWVRNPDYAPQVAEALKGVVLKPLDATKVPDDKLPDIPDNPRYDNINDLASALAETAGCSDRETTPTGELKCQTGSATSSTSNCAVLALHKTDTARDETLRNAIKRKGVPATLVTAGNWTINLCDSSLGTTVARGLGGTVVSYNDR
jgi:hypothetical protein